MFWNDMSQMESWEVNMILEKHELYVTEEVSSLFLRK